MYRCTRSASASASQLVEYVTAIMETPTTDTAAAAGSRVVDDCLPALSLSRYVQYSSSTQYYHRLISDNHHQTD